MRKKEGKKEMAVAKDAGFCNTIKLQSISAGSTK
jgi:hypothetical protein